MPPETTITAAIRHLLLHSHRAIVVALDGPSGAGKSTLALSLARDLAAAIVPCDDFFAAEISSATWDALTPAARAAHALDWRRLRTEAIDPLLAGKTARWHAFDFEAGERSDGSYALQTDFVERQPASVIVLDGAYSSRPELGNVIDLSVFVDAPLDIRYARLAAREDPQFLADWHVRWDVAERYYFEQLRPAHSFDLLVSTAL